MNDTNTAQASEPAMSEPSSATQTSEPSQQATATDQGTAQAATPTQDASGSLPADTRNAIPQDNAATTQPDPFEKRYKDQEAFVTRLSQERAQLTNQLKQYQGIDPREYTQLQQQVQQLRQQADAIKAKPWHPTHPDSQTTNARIQSMRSFVQDRQAIMSRQDLDANGKNAAIQALAESRRLTPDDERVYKEFEATTENDRQTARNDPRSFTTSVVQEMIAPAFQQMMQQYEQFQANKQYVQDFTSNPQNAPLLQSQRDTMLRALDPSVSRTELAQELAAAKYEAEQLRKKLTMDAESVHSAEAQQDATRTGATYRRDARNTPIAEDPRVEAEKLGLQGNQLLDFLTRKANERRRVG